MTIRKLVGKPKQTNAVRKPSLVVKSQTPAPVQVTKLEVPPPGYLLEVAMKEPDRKMLEEYTHVIRLLRNEKRFTFREIAEWLKGYGFAVDHNAVYREYTRGLLDEEEAIVASDLAEEERL